MMKKQGATVARSWWMGTIASGSPRGASVGLVRNAIAVLALFLAATGTACRAQDSTPEPKPDTSLDKPATTVQPAPPAKLEPEKGWLRVAKDYEVWVDVKQKQVIAGGHICLREGLLEMFACPKQTKEHESIVAVHTPARFVHGALLALGAQPGPPVQFDPVYKPAQGTEIAVEVFWRDADRTEHRVKAQDWVRYVKTGEALSYPWVFAGSGFWTDEHGKERFYYADGGEFICVSNFSTAMLDLPIESSAANDTLLFTAYTERIPPRDTPVFLFLTPKLEKSEHTAPPAAQTEAAAKDAEAKKSPDNAASRPQEEAKKPAAEPADKPREPAKNEPAGKI
jgi:hypothetical protein